MLGDMHRYVLAALLSVSPGALAHEGKGDCADEPGAPSHQAKATPRPASGAVLLRGEPIASGRPAVPVSTVLAQPEDGRTVLVEGVVRRACTQMGCWMELAGAGGGPGVRVTFKDHGFFVPTDSAGSKARVQGTVKVAQLSAAQAEHLRAEGSALPAGAQREVRLIATGVELRR